MSVYYSTDDCLFVCLEWNKDQLIRGFGAKSAKQNDPKISSN